ncbi:MAG: phasin family protein [Alphaproteobacteria bacterium]|nr:phasin family protein [Alphaproteobacteria bacterium]
MPDEVKSAQEPKTAAWTKALSTGFEPMYAMNRRAFECWARGMSRLSHDMAQFMQSRLLEDSVMWEKLASCRDVTDAVDCESRFAAKASADYSEAAQKFSRLVFEIASNCSTGLRHAPTTGE